MTFDFYIFLSADKARRRIKMGKEDAETIALKKELEALINKCKV